MAETFNKDMNIIAQSDVEIQIDPVTKDMNIIQKLDDEPNDVGGLTAAQLKAKFDEGGVALKTYINDSLIPQVLGASATEANREANEAQRQANETQRQTAEAGRVQAENARVQAEAGRQAAEAAREAAEAARETAEAARVQAESVRQSAEAEREAAFTASQASRNEQFQAAETQRQAAETARETAEAGREAAESGRVSAESARVQAETAREAAETARQSAEGQRQTNETARTAAESGRVSAETAREAAETARDLWEDYDSTKSYVPGNKVYYLGSSYVNTAACQGVLPTVEANWQIVAKKGADGEGSFTQKQADERYLQLTGGTMTGDLNLGAGSFSPRSINNIYKLSFSHYAAGIYETGTFPPCISAYRREFSFRSGDGDNSVLANIAIKDPTADAHGATKKYVDDAVAGAGIPSGVICMWSGAANAIPTGWALCNGSNGTPDLRDRFVVGAGSTYSVGAKGGEATHTLTTSEMPAHTHALGGNGGTGTKYITIVQTSDASNRTQAWINSGVQATGSGAAHNNLPPYYALCYIMKL